MKTNKRRGVSLVETVMAAGLAVLAFYGATMLFVNGSVSWIRGYGRMDAETKTNDAVRAISRQIREAMAVTVDANGLGITYQLPAKDSTGTYLSPIVWDGVTRRIELDGTSLKMVGGQSPQTICSNVILTDPDSLNGTTPYQVFTAGTGSITRSLTVMLVSSWSADFNKMATSRSREIIYLRNIPELEN